jgi:hypothetical protein
MMNPRFRHPATQMAAVAMLVLFTAGCEGSGNARFTPDAEVARSSLQTALTAWRDGKPCGPIEGKPSIHVADSLWQNGQQIQSFEIGDEQSDEDGIKKFSVKLTVTKTGKVESVSYYVNGRDPVWIYSETDYKRMVDMGNGTEPAKPRGAAGRRGGR